jgi:hypothetical protein
MPQEQIALRDVSSRPVVHHEPPYQLFLGTALAVGLFGGFLLAILLPLSGALEWDWGARWPELVQAHGQLQLLGFAGLFIAGMACRLMPRFSGRPLAYPAVARTVVFFIGGGVTLRAAAALVDADLLHDLAWMASAALVLAGASAFAAVVLGTLIHRDSRAEATAWFFVLGAAGLVVAGTLNFALTVRDMNDGLRMLSSGDNSTLLSVELYGFVLMFIGGVATRAVPALMAHPRSQIVARAAAAALAAGAAVHAASTLISEIDGPALGLARMNNVGLLIVAAALASIAWSTGVFHPRANRVARSSQTQFWFVRTGIAWLAVAAALLLWYGLAALSDGRRLDQFETDAVRHVLTVGVILNMMIGIALLVVPEFAGRRLQRPGEHAIVWVILLALNAGAALRIWPAMEGIDWLSSDRFWPMVAAGALATGAVAAFAFMFVQSYVEQRPAGWAERATQGRRGSQADIAGP